MTREQIKSLVAKNLPGWLSYAKQLLGNVADAEDAVQELAMKIAKGTFQTNDPDPAKHFRAWSIRCLYTVCMDTQRSKSRNRLRQASDESGFDQLSGSGPAPDANALKEELRADLDHCFAALSDQHRSVFLARSAGLKWQEIGDILGVPGSTASSRYQAARKQLQECLGQRGYGRGV